MPVMPLARRIKKLEAQAVFHDVKVCALCRGRPWFTVDHPVGPNAPRDLFILPDAVKPYLTGWEHPGWKTEDLRCRACGKHPGEGWPLIVHEYPAPTEVCGMRSHAIDG